MTVLLEFECAGWVAGGPELALFQLWGFRVAFFDTDVDFERRRIYFAKMTRGLVRLQHTGHSHFVTFTCFHRMKHLTTDQACGAVLRALENTRKRYGLRVYGFVLMPEHVHLLLSEPERGSLARALQSLKSASARMARGVELEDLGPRAPFWQTRYYDRYMRDHDEFSEKLRYIHRNPVKRGLCESPEEWPWSSFRHYWNGAEVGVEIESEWTARARQSQSRTD